MVAGEGRGESIVTGKVTRRAGGSVGGKGNEGNGRPINFGWVGESNVRYLSAV